MFDVGNTANPFRKLLKVNAQLVTQRPSKVPIQYRDKFINLLKKIRGTALLNKLVLLQKTNQTMVLLT